MSSINYEEGYGKTMSSLDNNGYLNADGIRGAIFAVIEYALDELKLPEGEVEKMVQDALR